MSTGDSQDATFKNSNVYVSWAYHSSSTSIRSTHTAYDRNIAINFLSVSPTETYSTGMINSGTSNNNNGGGNNNGGNDDNEGDNDDDHDSGDSKKHLYHLYALGIAVFSLMVLGIITTILPASVKSNIFTHFLLYRKVSKVIPYDFPLVSYVNQFLDLTLGELVIILVYAGLNVIWFVYGYLESQKVSSAFAKVIVFNYIFLFIPVTRYSVLQALFGISFERSIKFHKWIGVMVFLSATAHGIVEFIEFKDNIPFMFSVEDGYPLLGIIAWLALGLLLLFSMEPIRRKLYELFLVFHIPLTFITVTFSIIHGEGWINLLPYMAFSIILMVIDWTLRAIIGFGLHTQLVHISYDEESEVTTCVFEKRFLTLFHNPNHAHFVFVYIPQVSIYQLHPMTISSCEKLADSNHYRFTCHIKRMEGGSWSTKLANLAKSNKPIDSYHGVRVEGAYGNLSIPFFNDSLLSRSEDKKRTIVFIVAGIGATPANAILTALEDPKYNEPTPYKVYVNLTSRNEAILKHFRILVQHKPNVDCTFYITGTKPSKSIEMLEKGQSTGIDHSTDRRFIRGSRPNYVDYLNGVKAQVNQSKSLPYVSVFACGPSSMMNSVHNAVWSCSDMDCRFELHKEEFEF
ncbi:predicted protein [Naegleria gruberi]|uniref:Predicted protein n=1 Tax=Naegleria gruberi TaxID=5762 RepID=D2VJS8_NAEGR|nr:uncharacterized protein NAEGRDRAFT_69148 [Naegleria gruberi]EFC43003.1 predicted protein [Naegleria gruberi]|eukprot:XP_002675747.1 predicted protein [Naegleria gruberi strain NEG-M]